MPACSQGQASPGGWVRLPGWQAAGEAKVGSTDGRRERSPNQGAWRRALWAVRLPRANICQAERGGGKSVGVKVPAGQAGVTRSALWRTECAQS
jgi:hypothetical protein